MFNLKLHKKATSFDGLNLVLDVNDVMQILRMSKANAYKIMNSDTFPKMLIGKRILVQREDFKNWLNSLKK